MDEKRENEALKEERIKATKDRVVKLKEER